MMLEQRSGTIFCVLNGISRKDTIQMLEKLTRIKAMKKSQVNELYGCFKNGQEHINNEPRSSQPASIISSHVTEIRELLGLTAPL